jgi:hypothetical protein
MLEWNIQSRAHACQGCGRAFKDREALHTLLSDERQIYHRLDVCEACWQAQHAQGSNHRRGFVSHWESRYEPPPAHAPEPIQRETAETLLRKLVQLGDPVHAGAVFILAVMLERKRILRVKAQTRETGRRVLIYEHARGGDVFTIPDPGLQLDQLEAVQRDVAHLLEHGLPAPETAGNEAAPPDLARTGGTVPDPGSAAAVAAPEPSGAPPSEPSPPPESPAARSDHESPPV